MNEGYVKLPRSITSWQWYTDANVLKVYLHLLIKANFKEHRWQKEIIKKGQLVTGRKKLSEELFMNESMVRRILKKLEDTGDISVKTTNKYSVITLLKWDKMGKTINFFTSSRPTTDQQSTNNRPHYKKEKNVKNAKNYGARARERERDEFETIDWSLMDQIINAQ